MAKGIKFIKLRNEVAPPLFAFPEKYSSAPKLETIREEREEEDYYDN